MEARFETSSPHQLKIKNSQDPSGDLQALSPHREELTNREAEKKLEITAQLQYGVLFVG